jgi:hypothetical protein
LSKKLHLNVFDIFTRYYAKAISYSFLEAIPEAVKIFEKAFPKQNYFIITGDGEKLKSELTEFIDEKNLYFINNEDKWWKKGFIDFSNYNSFYIHNLYSLENIHFTVSAPEELKTFGIIWGHEFYGIREFWSEPTYGEQTQKLNQNNQNKIKRKSLLSKLFYKFSRATQLLTSTKHRALKPSIKLRRKAFNKLHYILTHVKPDYDNIINSLGINAKWGHFSYYSFEDYDLNIEVIPKKKYCSVIRPLKLTII